MRKTACYVPVSPKLMQARDCSWPAMVVRSNMAWNCPAANPRNQP